MRKIVWSYVHHIEEDAFGVGQWAIYSDERDRAVHGGKHPLSHIPAGIHKFDEFTVVLYVNKNVKEPRAKWRSLAYMLGQWHLETK